MDRNRITRGGATLIALAALLVIALLSGCDGSSSTGGSTAVASPPPSTEESPDASILNTVLSRQEAVVDAYATAIPHLSARNARTATYFRTQEQEHVDGLLKLMRGAARIPAEPQPETIEPGERKTETDWLVFLYEAESATIDLEVSAISGLEESVPPSLLVSTVANQAQHLVLLRGILGAAPLAQVPEAFENGNTEAPQ